MTPAARVQAAIELLDEIIDAAKSKGAPADRLIASYFKQRRYAGSKDRRAVRELVYSAIRACGPVPTNGRTAMLRLAELDSAIAPLFDGSNHGPATVQGTEKAAAGGVAPEWLVQELRASGIDASEAEALLTRAPLDIRVNTILAERHRLELPAEGEDLCVPNAIRFASGANVEQWPDYKAGLIEIQDLGSQLVCEAMNIQTAQTIVDLCAGAGGKTLAIAAKADNHAELVACDTDKRRLGNLAPRANRAGAKIDHTVLLDPGREMEALESWRGKADHVLVDAPCSGTGTWRRNPEGRWRLDRAELDRLVKLQDHVVDVAVQLLKPGGRLTFVTCSLLDQEGKDRIAAALDRHSQLSPDLIALPLGRGHGHGLRLTPAHDGTDGFFVATLRSE